MKNYQHKGIDYISAKIVDSNLVLTHDQAAKLKSQFRSNGACLKNAFNTAKLTDSMCVEGFVYCLMPCGKGADEKIIRHCWNSKNGKYFDVTKDFIWSNDDREKEFYYFIVAEYAYGDYLKDTNNKIEFLSNVATIAKEIDNMLGTN